MNNVVLVGRLTKEPELRYTANNNTPTINSTLAVNRIFKNQQGTKETDFINLVFWRKQAEILSQYANKGSLIGITGRIQTRNYENQQGQRVYVTEVVVENLQLLETRKMAEQRQSMQYANSSYNSTSPAADNNPFNSNFAQEKKNESPSFQGFSNEDNVNPFDNNPVEISDDELPF